ncbi:hypothetical protein E2C01_045380 [Portunus trituberculatus]|uniref:RRM domain-containing protein n=1 Tax=Portunus trituberculatus TaxID=210409 RepID=A0A5B7FVL9_PORTR|nr:hypothetical protein [Portunus trituberculatus]
MTASAHSHYSPSSDEVADLARETSSSGLSREEDSPPQVPPRAVFCSESSSEGRVSAGLDSLLMAYGTVIRTRLVYDKDFPSNRCYVTYLSCDEACLALKNVASLPLAGSGFKTELLHSRNITDSDMDYIPNLFDHHLENSVPEVRQIPPPRWFVAYYINGRGNFIRASWYLAKEISTIPEGNLKKYGKGVLVRAKDITQARMLQHLPCPTDSMFQTVKAHPTFNYSKGCVYRQDFYEFPEEEILAMCPSSVHKFISLGRARCELLYCPKDGTGVTTFASLAARSSVDSAGSKTSATSRSVGSGGPVRLANRVILQMTQLESSVRCDENNPDLTKVTHIVDVHFPPASPKPLKSLIKRHRGSAESIYLAQPKQSKVSPGGHDRESSRNRSAMVAAMF